MSFHPFTFNTYICVHTYITGGRRRPLAARAARGGGGGVEGAVGRGKCAPRYLLVLFWDGDVPHAAFSSFLLMVEYTTRHQHYSLPYTTTRRRPAGSWRAASACGPWPRSSLPRAFCFFLGFFLCALLLLLFFVFSGAVCHSLPLPCSTRVGMCPPLPPFPKPNPIPHPSTHQHHTTQLVVRRGGGGGAGGGTAGLGGAPRPRPRTCVCLVDLFLFFFGGMFWLTFVVVETRLLAEDTQNMGPSMAPTHLHHPPTHTHTQLDAIDAEALESAGLPRPGRRTTAAGSRAATAAAVSATSSLGGGGGGDVEAGSRKEYVYGCFCCCVCVWRWGGGGIDHEYNHRRNQPQHDDHHHIT